MNYKKWTFWLLFNLLIVACLGLLMRYKIVFSLPQLDQKHIQHAHSHFAFIGWISQALYLLLVHVLSKNYIVDFKKYERIFTINLLLSYAMLISFILKGYHISSNTFSFLLLINSIAFAFYFIRDLRKSIVPKLINKWFYFALFFNVLSMLGTFALAYMAINKIYNQELQLASVYYYLHFQYNGWFIAACMGLFLYVLNKKIELKRLNLITWVFCISIIPNYFLSVLWMKLPIALYSIVVLSAFLQLFVWGDLLWQMYNNKKILFMNTSAMLRNLIYLLLAAFTLKLMLQLGSTIPYLSHLAYSLRPIVIAYLHLVLLVILSVFILSFLLVNVLSFKNLNALFLFVVCILINEVLLGVQSIAGAFSTLVPNIHMYLFLVSIAIVLSVLWLLKKYRIYD